MSVNEVLAHLDQPDQPIIDARATPRYREEVKPLDPVAGRDPASVVHQCGSGVSSVPNLLAMEVAGFPPTRLFAGSWSEWCRDPSRPVAKGSSPR